MFDLFILRRPQAAADYEPEIRRAAQEQFQRMTADEIATLTNTVLLGLPGSEEAFDLSGFQGYLDAYAGIDDRQLRENLYYFIREVAPVADELGMTAVHSSRRSAALPAGPAAGGEY